MINNKKIYWHSISVEQVAKILDTDIEKGLSEKEVEKRFKKFGPNKLPEEKPFSRIHIFFSQFKSPLVYILLIAGIVTLILGKWTDTVIIFMAVILNAVVGYFQEKKAEKTLFELKKVLKPKAIVLREGQEKEILQERLVPGDIIVLKRGEKVPADARIIESLNLQVNEAVLTGEWLPAEKHPNILPQHTPISDRDNMVYMGSTCEEGEGKAIVVQIGKNTEIGKIAGLVQQTEREKTPYQKKISRFSKIIGIIISFICLFIFIEGVATGGDFVEMFTMAVAVGVAAIPESLPVGITVILALGMQRILRKKGLIRRLVSAETLGSTSVICTDKTLTLTEGKMKVAEIKSDDERLCLKIAALCNEAFVENPNALLPFWRVRGRPTDKALIMAAAEKKLNKYKLEKELPQIDKVPFNTENKFIATLHQAKKRNLLFVSGAPEKVISLSSKVLKRNSKIPITSSIFSKLNQDLTRLTTKGERVIGIAYKETEKKKIEIDDIKNLVFVGFIGLKDPLREDAKKAINICKEAGIKPVIVTGDHLLTAKAVAKELGLQVKKENIIEGEQLNKISDEELIKKLPKINLFARVSPEHKRRIVSLWQKRNQVVAMTGDGINDAPALRKADIGVSLGSGTEVAKEVSDLVLLTDNFSIIVAAVEEGRAILDNIRKLITYLFSDTFIEVFLVGISLLFGLPLPFSAVQILWVNILEDGPLAVGLAFEKKERDLMKHKPQPHYAPLLTKEMKTLIFTIGVVNAILLLSLFGWLLKYSEYDISHIRSIMFAGLSIDSFFYVFSCKSLRRNLWQIDIFSNKFLIVVWILSLIMLFAALYLPPLQVLLCTRGLNIFDWIIILILGVVNLVLIEGIKRYFIVRNLVR